jgi:sulfoxide reductase heme-binding subunit YedZ
MFELYKTYKKEHPRLTNNIILTVVSLLGCLVAVILASPTQSLLEALAVGTGYVGLGLLALTLLIGPLNMLKVRKNPVNLNFRRDAGIWAGLLSLLHVLLVFVLEIDWGGTLLGYFLYKDGSLKLNLFGISNYIGLAATLILIFLLVLSNNHFLKALKGKKWKNLQRFNYLLFALALGHTFTQQVNNVRGLWMVIGALLVTAAVMVGQAVGFKIYRKREQERKVAPAAKPAPARVAASTAPAARVAAPVQPAPAVSGFSKLKVASAVSLLALLGLGAGLEGLNLLNTPATAQTGSLASDETTTGATSSSPAATTPAASETAAATTAAATTASSTTAATTTAATTTTTATTTAATTTAATTTAATTTAAATTAVTSSSSSTTVSNASKSSGSTHTGGS